MPAPIAKGMIRQSTTFILVAALELQDDVQNTNWMHKQLLSVFLSFSLKLTDSC